MTVIDTDYLVVGAGAAGMAFVDALIADCDADVVMVERRHCPGGHWNDAYPFVRIHQASACYGVNSTALGNETIDETGPNAGFYERSTAVEICAYFQRVLEDVLLPSGRVRFFGMCDYVGDWDKEHVFTSRVTGASTTVRVRRKIVDSTYLDVTVPATHTPPFAVDPDVRLIPPGELTRVAERPQGYTVLGCGKTAMDACYWLMENGEDPERIQWIRPRDPWVMDRMGLQPRDLVTETMEALSLDIEVTAKAQGLADLWPRLEDCEQLFRFDPDVTPTTFRGAILSAAERKALEEIKRVVRMGRVRRLGKNRVELDQGEISTERGHIYVDCTARGFNHQPVRPVFETNRIVIQSLIGGLQTYYAALEGYIESTGRDDTEKNRLTPPVAQLEFTSDWIRLVRGVLETSALHATEPDVLEWQDKSRLNLTRGIGEHGDDPRMQAALSRWEGNAEEAFANTERLLAESQDP